MGVPVLTCQGRQLIGRWLLSGHDVPLQIDRTRQGRLRLSWQMEGLTLSCKLVQQSAWLQGDLVIEDTPQCVGSFRVCPAGDHRSVYCGYKAADACEWGT